MCRTNRNIVIFIVALLVIASFFVGRLSAESVPFLQWKGQQMYYGHASPGQIVKYYDAESDVTLFIVDSGYHQLSVWGVKGK